MGMLSYAFALFISVLSSLFFVFAILYSDRKSKEPIYMIILALLSGVFTIASSLVVGKLILPHLNYLGYSSYNFMKVLIFAFVEEASKLTVLYFFIQKNSSFDDIYDGFVYSSLIALSFGAFETVMYVFSESDFSSMINLALVRGITSIPLHLICGIVMGYYVGTEKFAKTKRISIFKLFMSLLLPTIIHTIYNYYLSQILVYITDDLLFILLIMVFFIPLYIVGIAYTNRIKNVNAKFLNENSPFGLLTKSEYINKEERYWFYI